MPSPQRPGSDGGTMAIAKFVIFAVAILACFAMVMYVVVVRSYNAIVRLIRWYKDRKKRDEQKKVMEQQIYYLDGLVMRHWMDAIGHHGKAEKSEKSNILA